MTLPYAALWQPQAQPNCVTFIKKQQMYAVQVAALILAALK
jgi:hypothetical protein